MTPLDIVYIGGSGRSGSTVLALLLGNVPDVVAVGEVGHLWERGLVENELCGCGAPFRDCPFWTAVGEEAFGGWDAVDVEETLMLRRSVARIRRWPVLLAPRLRPSLEADARRFAERTADIYQAVRAVSGSRIVVDSSKSPSQALLLRLMPGVRPRIVHLVRDSRGVAYSWAKHVRRPEATRAERASMVRYSAVHSSLDWTMMNLPFDLLRIAGVPRLRVRYEDLAASPRRAVERVLRFAGAAYGSPDLAFLDQDAIEMPPQHTVSGNPIRLEQGAIRVRVDDEWHDRMRTRDRAVVLAFTWPLELAYGYGRARRP
jgi:hypothetical protein